MKENRQKALDLLFKLEGFESQTTGDSGGDTIYGITSRWFPASVQQIKAFLASGQKGMAVACAQDFYLHEFWTPLGCDNLPYPLDCYAFIQAVNMGANTVKNMIRALPEASAFMKQCELRYKTLAAANTNDAQFLKGWENRLTAIQIAFPEELIA